MPLSQEFREQGEGCNRANSGILARNADGGAVDRFAGRGRNSFGRFSAARRGPRLAPLSRKSLRKKIGLTAPTTNYP